MAPAGIGDKAGVSKASSVENSDALFSVNVRAPYFLLRQLLPVNYDCAEISA